MVKTTGSGQLPVGASTVVLGDDDTSSAELVVERPERIGRYPILHELGAGGMGVVYAAFDEALDRKIALKVLRPRGTGTSIRQRRRMQREAQAMARVSHPNVITVHEVGVDNTMIYIAMEFVAGRTLKQWLAAEPRSWREVVGMFLQVAEGLEAIHEVGLVHRDVKPGNVMIGDDGRIRVLDLGLVRTDAHDFEDDDEPSTSTSTGSGSGSRLSMSAQLGGVDPLAKSLTRTGEFVGTPAYMSREQLLGLELGPAADVFSFSVALYHALYGVHPFRGADWETMVDNVVRGQVATPADTRGVPARLQALVVSGLASDPRQRPASMRAYADVLASVQAWAPRRLRRSLLAVAGTALAAVVGVLSRPPATVPTPSCDVAERAIARSWNGERGRAIRAALLASERPYAGALAGRVIASLDEYAGTWAEARARACRERAGGRSRVLDARVVCLERRRRALDETVELLVDPRRSDELLANAGEMVAGLPRIDACEQLESPTVGPSSFDPARATQITELERRLVRAEAWAHAGRIDDARELGEAIATEAEAIGHAPTQIAALLGVARAELRRAHDPVAMSELLSRALGLALAAEQPDLAAEAIIRRLYVHGLAPGGGELALADLPVAEAMVERAGSELELRALLFNNAGTLHLSTGDREAARAAFDASVELQTELLGDDHLELAVGLANLGMLTEDDDARRRVHARMIEIHEHRLGPEHPRTLDARLLAGLHESDPSRAGDALAQLCPRMLTGGEAWLAGECELERGRLEHARGRLDRASEAFELARDSGWPSTQRRALLDAYLGLAGETASARLDELRAELDDAGSTPAGDWWQRLEQAELGLVLGQELLARRSPRAHAAVRLLERSLAELEAIADSAPPLEHARLLADARRSLAGALELIDHDSARGEDLRAAALTWYRRWPDAYAAHITALAGAPTTKGSRR